MKAFIRLGTCPKTSFRVAYYLEEIRKFLPLGKRGTQINIFLIHENNTLGVLIRSSLPRCFYWVPTIYPRGEIGKKKYKNIYFLVDKSPDLELWKLSVIDFYLFYFFLFFLLLLWENCLIWSCVICLIDRITLLRQNQWVLARYTSVQQELLQDSIARLNLTLPLKTLTYFLFPIRWSWFHVAQVGTA